MRRTNIYLEERQCELLDRIADQEGTSRAEVVRRLIDRGLTGDANSLETDLEAIEASFGALAGADFETDVLDRSDGERGNHLEAVWHGDGR